MARMTKTLKLIISVIIASSYLSCYATTTIRKAPRLSAKESRLRIDRHMSTGAQNAKAQQQKSISQTQVDDDEEILLPEDKQIIKPSGGIGNKKIEHKGYTFHYSHTDHINEITSITKGGSEVKYTQDLHEKLKEGMTDELKRLIENNTVE